MSVLNTATEDVKCPLCGSDNPRRYRCEKRVAGDAEVVFGLNRCRQCGLHYVSPRLTLSAQNAYYSNNYTGSTLSGARHSDTTVGEKEYRQFITYLNTYLPAGGRVLDVGCGVGNMFSYMHKSMGYHLTGLELSDQAANIGRKKGYNIVTGSMEDFICPSESFDALILMYVVEHVSSPISVLKKAYDLLRPGGVVLIALPNYNYLRIARDNRIAKVVLKKHATIFPEEHLQNFTPKTLQLLLNCTGFKTVFRGMASPMRTGPFWIQFIKSGVQIPLLLLHHLGYTIGGMHVVAQKQVTEV